MTYFTVTTENNVTLTVPAASLTEAVVRVESMFDIRVTAIAEDIDTAATLIAATN